MKPHDQAPEGRRVGDVLLYGEPERGAIVAKGYWVEAQDLRGASFDRLNAFQEQVRSLLSLIRPGIRLQLQWMPDSDYRRALLKYHLATESIVEPAVRKAREERFARYWARMTDRKLRRERTALFLSLELPEMEKKGRSKDASHYERLIGSLQTQFQEFAATAQGIFGNELALRPMTDADHCGILWRFLNPGLAGRSETVPEFGPELSIQETAWHGDGVGQPEGGFYLDGNYHAVLTLVRWPQRTRPGIVTHLTGLPFLDYCITVNVTPAAIRQEISREEKSVERLQGEYADKPRPSLLVALKKKERKVEALSGGFTRPFFVNYVIRAWAPTKDGLREKVAAIQAAIQAMDGAQYFESALATTARKLFFSTWPGWTHSSYRHRELYAEDAYLADMLPLSGTFTGDLENAEALYDGSHRNLVGLTTRVNGSPQHAVIVGMTGAGKSEFLHDLMLQTAGFFDYTVIVEEGLSHKKYTEAFGEKPIVVHPDSPFTINYFDTQAMPVSQLHITTAVALVSRMVGMPENAEHLAVRQAQLSQYVHQLYEDAYLEWSRQKPGREEAARRLAYAVHRWRETLPAGTTPLEAFVDFRDRRNARDAQAEEFFECLPEAEITAFAQEPATRRLVALTASAFYGAEDYPTHGALVELLAYARLPEHPKDEIDRLATLLRAWTTQGIYGKLLDGPSTVSLKRKVAHFETGLIPEQSVEMKAVAGLLITGFTRQHILSLPRSMSKRIVYEEVLRLLNIPGGGPMVAEGFGQLRKFNCWVLSVILQYAQFRQSSVRSAVIGNAKQFYFMRQSDRSDLSDLSADLNLPETAIDAIQRYPMPEQLPVDGRYSSLCAFTPTSQPPQCGTVRHVQAREHKEASRA